MNQTSLFDAPAPVPALAPNGQVDHRGRPCTLYRDCGEHVWLRAEDARIGGPFYWVRKEAVRGG